MIRWYLRNWYAVSAAIAVGVLVVLAARWGELSVVGRLMLIQLALINLHFTEEFGIPGGFPVLANKLELHSDKPSHHPLNQASVAFGNMWFALVVYLPAALHPQWTWLALSVSLFGFIELAMHSVYFNRLLHHYYNGGLATAALMSVAAVVFLATSWSDLSWWMLVPALAWPMLNYLVVFSWLAGKVWNNPETRFPFTEAEMRRFGRWTERAVAMEEAR